jgi:hypothetical protein
MPLHLFPKREFELLLAVFGGSQDLTCKTHIEDREVLNLGPHGHIRGSSLTLERSSLLHNLSGAEHRANGRGVRRFGGRRR